MTRIYKDFAAQIEALNSLPVGDKATSIGTRRAYMSQGKPYLDNVHFQRVSESWMTHERLQRHVLNSPELHGRIWAGTAGEVNLSYITASQAPAAILYDINPLQTFFWQRFFNLIAEIPDPQVFAGAAKPFIKDFYFDLTHSFNLAGARESYPYLHMSSPDPRDHMLSVEEQIERRREAHAIFSDGDHEEEIDISDIKGPQCLKNVEELSSPVLNMTYKQFYNHIRTAMGWEGTGWRSCGDKSVCWVSNPAHYEHLHNMAKHGAVAALTLDVSDTPSCTQLRTCLDDITYDALDITDGAITARTPQKGARIGNLYTSNVLYYLDYSDEEIEACRQKGEVPRDFSGQEITRETLATTLQNLRGLTHEDSAILRFERIRNGLFGRPDFEPLFDMSDEDAICPPRPHEAGGLCL